jgi:hypothetical protein
MCKQIQGERTRLPMEEYVEFRPPHGNRLKLRHKTSTLRQPSNPTGIQSIHGAKLKEKGNVRPFDLGGLGRKTFPKAITSSGRAICKHSLIDGRIAGG